MYASFYIYTHTNKRTHDLLTPSIYRHASRQSLTTHHTTPPQAPYGGVRGGGAHGAAALAGVR